MLRYLQRFPWLSLTIRPYHPSLLVGFLDYIFCLYRAVVGKFLLVGQHLHICVKGVYRRTSLMSSSLLLQQYPTCLVCLIWMVLEMGGWWPYCCCIVGCGFQDFFNIAHNILALFPSSFFSIHLVSIHVVHPYSINNATAAWKKKLLKNYRKHVNMNIHNSLTSMHE